MLLLLLLLLLLSSSLLLLLLLLLLLWLLIGSYYSVSERYLGALKAWVDDAKNNGSTSNCGFYLFVDDDAYIHMPVRGGVLAAVVVFAAVVVAVVLPLLLRLLRWLRQRLLLFSVVVISI